MVNSFMLDEGEFYINDENQLVFYIRPEQPEDPNEAKNWLPSPKDAGFRLTARFSGPESPLIDGSYPTPRPVGAGE